MEKGSKSGVKRDKKLLIVVIAVLLICIGLSGCNEQTGISSEKNKFVGTWENEG